MSDPSPAGSDRRRTAALRLLPLLLLPLACGSGDGAMAPDGAPASVAFDAADASAPAGMPFPGGTSVVVRTADGVPVTGAVVRFQILAGNGWLSAAADTTASDGRAMRGARLPISMLVSSSFGTGRWLTVRLPGQRRVRRFSSGTSSRLALRARCRART